MKQYLNNEIEKFAEDDFSQIKNYDKAFDRKAGFKAGFILAQKLLNPEFVPEVNTSKGKKQLQREAKKLMERSWNHA